MNCKPGDLAIVVRANVTPHFVGRIVKVIATAPIHQKVVTSLGPMYADGSEPAWIVECGREFWLHGDKRLCPIRDNPGEDEMLRIVGKPTEVVAS